MGLAVFFGVVLLGAAVAVATHRNKTTKRITILEYQRGVKFVDGVFDIVLEPGAYRIKTSEERVEVVDLRAQPILIEGFAFKDAEQKDWIISLGCNLLVKDPHGAISKLTNQLNDSVAMMRDSLREAVVGLERSLLSDRETVRQRVEQELNNHLEPVGMRIEKLEITELWSRIPDQREVGFAKA